MWPGAATAEPSIRVALFNTELSRKGPGLLLRDIARGDDKQINAVLDVIVAASADILVLQGIDYDHEARTLGALRDALATRGMTYLYQFTQRPNTGLRSGLDLDGDGTNHQPRDAHGFGWFPGQGGMAILSRFPFGEGGRDFSTLLWADLPGVVLPKRQDGRLFPSRDVYRVLRLSSTGHWDVPVMLPSGQQVHILTYHATPPVFDGPEDRNGLRNAAETAFWLHWLEGAFGEMPDLFVMAAGANLDPVDGDGRKDALRRLLSHPDIQDPRPRSQGGILAAQQEKGANLRHASSPAFDTVNWADDEGGPGNLRVDYLLPASGLHVAGSGVLWPSPDSQSIPSPDTIRDASRHRLIWVDITLPNPS